MRRCSHCGFWVKEENPWATSGQPRGQCRRLPPSLGRRGSSRDDKPYTADAEFPVTRSDWWCGEFSSRADRMGFVVPISRKVVDPLEPKSPDQQPNSAETKLLLLSQQEAAERLRISSSTLGKLTREGQIAATRVGKRLLVLSRVPR
jgi:excisionase family DNA binding protein